ncbi:uncharacterized protein BP5553_05115 [Venustampulla echinocandica]|uniref:Uncharacterized protein n=1 Tax=Venustampulla echinocandica TaxID=2656787 RepID=A0A370TQ94_9HELO|nr:uncharacterized protein BP5553_05115 [Venustampulla echinocandica]RDL37682.1 hypothetical protein BP5553_05115 [Venustampulla echinocandica]
MSGSQRRQERQLTPSDGFRPASNSARNRRPKVVLEQLGEGCIVWLPTKDENDDGTIKCIKERCCENKELHSEGYGHPILVLKIKQHGICSFAEVTSKQTRYRVPIMQDSPADPEAPVTWQLYLEKGKMDCKSYIKTEHIFDVSVALLRTCSFRWTSKPSDIRLTHKSYQYLAKKVGLEGYKTWVSTTLLDRGQGGYRVDYQQISQIQQRMDASVGADPQACMHNRNAAPLPLLQRSATVRIPTVSVANSTWATRPNARPPRPPTANMSSWQTERERRAHQRPQNGADWEDLESDRARWPSDDSDGDGSLSWGYLLLGVGMVGFGTVVYLFRWTIWRWLSS